MSKIVNEFVTYWGPSIADWGNGPDKRFIIDRDEELLKNSAVGGRKPLVRTVLAAALGTCISILPFNLSLEKLA
jgi:hypothetical protein